MTNSQETPPAPGRKLFFGLFIFPLLIAVGMAVILCSVVLLTSEQETPESLVASIKSGSPGKRWQKAFELSNELNTKKESIRSEGLMQEIIHILNDTDHYDPKTRGYMAIALSHFHSPEAIQALRANLKDPSEDVQLYSAWAIGVLGAKEAAPEILPFLSEESAAMRKMAAYVLGALEYKESAPALRKLLEDPVADVRWNAALSLARLGDDSGEDVLIRMMRREEFTAEGGMTEEDIEKAMMNAAKGLALILKPESIKILEIVSHTDKNLRVRQAAMDAIQYQNDRQLGKIKS